MALPATLPDPDRHTPLWECTSCEKTKPRATRQRMHCGLMSRSEWRSDPVMLPPDIAGQPYPSDECPGSLVRRPEVAEAAKLGDALEAGILDRVEPLRLRIATECAQLVRRAFNLHTNAKIKNAGKQATPQPPPEQRRPPRPPGAPTKPKKGAK